YKGRMGSPKASIYLGSPLVAAVAALTGVIDDPRSYLEASDAEFEALVERRRSERGDRGAASSRSGDRLEALTVVARPPRFAPQPRDGERLMARAWVFGDDLDTDQIVPGRYAPFMVGEDKYQSYAFCDARPGFAKEVKPGDILVGGENFGCGSSREYAVSALKKL